MSKKNLLFVFLIADLWLGIIGSAQCWNWIMDRRDNAPQNGFMLAYDENEQKVALLAGNLELWYFDGEMWDKYWEGFPDTGSDSLLYLGPAGIYFDENLHSLILFGIVGSYPEWGGIAAFRYTPGQGWKIYGDYLGMVIPLDGSQVLTLAYDSLRKRVVTLMTAVDVGNVTVEYDGFQFYMFPNPQGINFWDGYAAYDPEAQKVVFLGIGTYPNTDIHTFEYDGTTWTQVDDQPTCPGTNRDACWPAGLAYNPDLHGIVTIPMNIQETNTWLYIDGGWKILNTASSLTTRGWSWMTYDYKRKFCFFIQWASM